MVSDMDMLIFTLITLTVLTLLMVLSSVGLNKAMNRLIFIVCVSLTGLLLYLFYVLVDSTYSTSVKLVPLFF